MTKDNMTIRFQPDGFSFPDEEHFHEVAPGPDFQHRLQHAVLEAMPECEMMPDLNVEVVSERIVFLPPHVTDADTAALMYHTTLCDLDDDEQVLLQPLSMPNSQDIVLCFGIDRSLYLFLERNFGEVTYSHHIASLLSEGARQVTALPNEGTHHAIALPNEGTPQADALPATGTVQVPATLVTRCDNGFLELALFRNRALTLSNVYRTPHPDNRRYFVLNTWVQEHLDQLNDLLLILGHSDADHQLKADLAPFIKHTLQQER